MPTNCHHMCHYEDFRCFVPCCAECGTKWDESHWLKEQVEEVLKLHEWAQRTRPAYYKQADQERFEKYKAWLEKQEATK